MGNTFKSIAKAMSMKAAPGCRTPKKSYLELKKRKIGPARDTHEMRAASQPMASYRNGKLHPQASTKCVWGCASAHPNDEDAICRSQDESQEGVAGDVA